MFNHCRGGYEKYVNMDDKGQTSEPDCYPRHARDQYSCDKAIVDRYRRRQHFFFSQAEVDGIKWRVINPSSGHERLTSGHLTRHDSIVGTCTSCPDKSAYLHVYVHEGTCSMYKPCKQPFESKASHRQHVTIKMYMFNQQHTCIAGSCCCHHAPCTKTSQFSTTMTVA